MVVSAPTPLRRPGPPARGAGRRGSRSRGAREAESFLADAPARVDVDPRPEDGVAQARVRADPAVGADHDALADGGIGSDPAAGADLRPGLDQGERSDLGRGIDVRARSATNAVGCISPLTKSRSTSQTTSYRAQR